MPGCVVLDVMKLPTKKSTIGTMLPGFQPHGLGTDSTSGVRLCRAGVTRASAWSGGFPGSPLREGLFDGRRLGSLRAGSQVIRAHWLRPVNDECGSARITCSLRPC